MILSNLIVYERAFSLFLNCDKQSEINKKKKKKTLPR
jgi:hypothetical protein